MIDLPVKTPARIVPEYSLTGDLLSFTRCERQYRYYNGSSLPPARPVQMWYGEFIHAMLEEAFLRWRTTGRPFPWPATPIEDARPGPPPPGTDPHDIRALGWPIEEVLAHAGKRARSREARRAAYERATACINTLGPMLFPLIAASEEKLLGTRTLPAGPDIPARAEQYGLKGIVDVLSEVTLGDAAADNPLRAAIAEACGLPKGAYEVIVDYKGTRRPPVSDDPRSDWQLGAWQVLTYAWLRGRQPGARPIAAGVLLYVNELAPGGGDHARLLREVRAGVTDVAPTPNSEDDNKLRAYLAGTDPELSAAFRMRRAIRVVPVTQVAIDEAVTAFDSIVSRIETRVTHEAGRDGIRNVWRADCEDHDTCVACDFKRGCEQAVSRGWDRDAAPG